MFAISLTFRLSQAVRRYLLQFQNQLNSACEAIHLTMEQPANGALAFLNCIISLRKDKVETSCCNKPYKKIIIIHWSSVHPAMVEIIVLKRMKVPAVRISTNKDTKQRAVREAEVVAKKSGYNSLRFVLPRT